MYQIVLIIHMLVAMTLIGLVLIQHGKGADVGAAFGSGASGTVFGSQGVGSFLFKFTSGLAITFFVTSLCLSSMLTHQYRKATTVAVPKTNQVAPEGIPIPDAPE